MSKRTLLPEQQEKVAQAALPSLQTTSSHAMSCHWIALLATGFKHCPLNLQQPYCHDMFSTKLTPLCQPAILIVLNYLWILLAKSERKDMTKLFRLQNQTIYCLQLHQLVWNIHKWLSSCKGHKNKPNQFSLPNLSHSATQAIQATNDMHSWDWLV